MIYEFNGCMLHLLLIGRNLDRLLRYLPVTIWSLHRLTYRGTIEEMRFDPPLTQAQNLSRKVLCFVKSTPFFIMPYYLYILQSLATGTYYIGTTSDLEDRLHRHNSGRSKYTKRHVPWKLVYQEEYPTRSAAMKRERQLKNWKSRDRIESLVRMSPGT
jgi:putative endonuclease